MSEQEQVTRVDGDAPPPLPRTAPSNTPVPSWGRGGLPNTPNKAEHAAASRRGATPPIGPNVLIFGATGTEQDFFLNMVRLSRRPFVEGETKRRCANCGHTEPHDGPAGDIPGACTRDGCNCGYFSPGVA